MGLLNLEEQLAFYRRYHSNNVNVGIHMIFVPAIHFTSTLLATNVPLGPLAEQTPYANLGVVGAVGYGVYYSLLDWKYGVPAFAGLVYASVKATDLVTSAGGDLAMVNKIAGGIWVASWLAQFAGHKWAEKKAPALLTNLTQALVLAPFFVLFEFGYMLGLRRDVIDKVDARIKAEDGKTQ